MSLPSKRIRRFIATLLAAFASPLVASADAVRPTVDFTKDIQPILESRCLACHGSGKQEAGLRLDRKDDLFKGGDSGPPVEKGKSAVSLLVERIATGDASMRMPPEGTALSTEEVAKLKTWIDHGAAWPDGVSLAERTKADKSWWSLRPLSKAELPQRSDIPPPWAKNPIDRFIFDEMEKHGLSPSQPAERRTLIRRATYDLIGLPPTPEEVAAFENDKSPDAYEKLIDRLLASPHYGEHWGRHWLDVVRFGESTGFERNVIIDNAWPFRDYVIRSFNDDKPFDRLTLEHLAGDVIGKNQPDVEVGTTFLVAGAYDNVGNQDPVQAKIIRANTLDDMVTATGTAFLGLTINCARCHNHKFDPIPQADYYRIQSAFAGVRHGERAIATAEERKKRSDALAPLDKKQHELTAEKNKLENEAIEQAKPAFANRKYSFPKVNPQGNEDRFTPVKARFVRMTPLSSDADPHSTGGLRLDELEVWSSGPDTKNVALAATGGQAKAAERVAEDFANAYSPMHLIDGKFSAKWYAVGDPRVTIELAREETIDRVVMSSDRIQAFAAGNGNIRFVGEYILEVSLDGQQWTKVFDSLERTPINDNFLRARMLKHSLDDKEEARLRQISRELAANEKAKNAVPPLREVWVGHFSKPSELTYIHQGGDPGKPGDVVAPASLNVLSDVTKPFELSKDADEGQRRVELAKWLVASDNPLTPRVLANRIWYYHFGTGIVETPSDFGYLGGKPTHPELLDWLARRLHHHSWKLKPLHREIMLSQTYQQAGGYRDDMVKIDSSARYLWRFPPRRLFAEEVRDTMLQVSGRLDPKQGGPGFRLYKYLQDNVATYIPLDVHGPETWRRAVYHQNARASRVDVLSDFDCPDNAFSAPTRASTTTPLQALTLLNHSFTREMAKSFSERVQRDAGKEDIAGQIRRAFELAYSREPTENERVSATTLVQKHGLATLCRAILNSNELVYLQ